MPKLPKPREKIGSEASLRPPSPESQRSSSPKVPGGESLDEVERALSILQGRHPDAVRTERETNKALAAKRAEADARFQKFSAEDKRRWTIRGSIGAAVLIAMVGSGVMYSRLVGRGRAVEAALGPMLALYASAGWTRVNASRFAVEEAVLDASEATCFVALASSPPGDGAISVDRPAGALEGTGSIAWCTCGAEQATVRLRDPRAGGLIFLRIGAAQVGGDYGLFFVDPAPHVIAPPNECSRPSLDAWIEKGAPVHTKCDSLDAKRVGALGREGFALVGAASPALPFAVVPPAADTCVIALSSALDDLLSLRLPGGDRPIVDAKGTLGFCADHAQSVTVWRKGKGEVVALRVAASRIGGSHGIEEVTRRLGLPPIGVWVSDDELVWDATATLRASGIVPAEITASGDGQAVKTARLIAISVAGAVVKADTPKETTYLCDPPLTDTSRGAVCVQSLALPWHAVGAMGKAGIVESTLPFWMLGLASGTDTSAMTAQLALVKLARRLSADGFEATTLDGVTEIEGGAVVTGRGGSDAIVALQTRKDPPWASPCTTGDVWTVDSDPAVVSLAAGAQVTVSCAPFTPKAAGRTVVFRHASASRRAQ